MSDTESVKPETIDTSLLQARYGAEAAPAAGKFNDVLRSCSRIGRCALNTTASRRAAGIALSAGCGGWAKLIKQSGASAD